MVNWFAMSVLVVVYNLCNIFWNAPWYVNSVYFIDNFKVTIYDCNKSFWLKCIVVFLC